MSDVIVRLLDRLRALGCGDGTQRLAVRLLLNHWADPSESRDVVFWLGYPRYGHPRPRPSEVGFDLYPCEAGDVLRQGGITLALRDLLSATE